MASLSWASALADGACDTTAMAPASASVRGNGGNRVGARMLLPPSRGMYSGMCITRGLLAGAEGILEGPVRIASAGTAAAAAPASWAAPGVGTASSAAAIVGGPAIAAGS